jgi:hypothetical protein
MYTKALLQGAIEKASRDSTIEGANTGVLDAKVSAIVRVLAAGNAGRQPRTDGQSMWSVGKTPVIPSRPAIQLMAIYDICHESGRRGQDRSARYNQGMKVPLGSA